MTTTEKGIAFKICKIASERLSLWRKDQPSTSTGKLQIQLEANVGIELEVGPVGLLLPSWTGGHNLRREGALDASDIFFRPYIKLQWTLASNQTLKAREQMQRVKVG